MHRNPSPPDAAGGDRSWAGHREVYANVPHNPLSPVSTAACLQIAACIPNFAIQEYPSRTPEIDGGKELLGNDLAIGLSDQIDGFLAIPEAPGIGLELVEDVERRFPMKPRPIRMRPHVDGSMVDM